jgi:hypothetical protein
MSFDILPDDILSIIATNLTKRDKFNTKQCSKSYVSCITTVNFDIRCLQNVMDWNIFYSKHVEYIKTLILKGTCDPFSCVSNEYPETIYIDKCKFYNNTINPSILSTKTRHIKINDTISDKLYINSSRLPNLSLITTNNKNIIVNDKNIKIKYVSLV